MVNGVSLGYQPAMDSPKGIKEAEKVSFLLVGENLILPSWVLGTAPHSIFTIPPKDETGKQD